MSAAVDLLQFVQGLADGIRIGKIADAHDRLAVPDHDQFGQPLDGILVEKPVAFVDGGGVLHCKFLAVFAQVVVTRPQAIDDTQPGNVLMPCR